MILVLPPFSEAIGFGKRRWAVSTPRLCDAGASLREGPWLDESGPSTCFSVSTQHLLTLNTR